jgi:tetratricopeptide (TPR) repeat protein
MNGKVKALQTAAAGLRSFGTANRSFLLSLLVLVVVWRTFVPCLSNGFTNYDDPTYVWNNPHVKSGLTPQNVLWAFTSSTAANWHPLTMLTHIIDCQLYRGMAGGHHLLNVALHCVNSLLLFLLLDRLTHCPWGSFWVALFFGVHPLRVESVAWISERKDVLSTFFSMLTALAYAKYVLAKREARSGARRYYWLAVLWLALGLLSKPMLVTVPCLLLLLDFWPLGRLKHERPLDLVLEKAPLFVLSVAFSIVTCFTQRGAMYPIGCMPLSVRLANVPVAYSRYLGKLFYPVDLACLYPYPVHWPAGRVFLCTALLSAVSVAALRGVRRRPYVLVGWLWFLGALFPVIGLAQTGIQSMADRYSYIPSIGVLIPVVWISRQFAERWKVSPLALSVVAAGLALTCVALTRRQISYWRDPESLWRHAAAVTDLNYSAARMVGQFELQRANYDAAITNFEYALMIRGDFVEARLGLARALRLRGRPDEAIRTLDIASRLNATNAPVRAELGLALLAAGRRTEGLSNLTNALKLQPEFPGAADVLRILANPPAVGDGPPAGTNDLPVAGRTNAK